MATDDFNDEIETSPAPRPPRRRGILEKVFEAFLWQTRLLVLFAVIASLFASFTLFIVGSIDTYNVIAGVWSYYIGNDHSKDIHIIAVTQIIGALDLFLIAVVLMLFSFGLYELFISRIEPAENSEVSGILQIYSLDGLKDKVAQVIIMALIVKYFQMVFGMQFSTALEMTYIALSILALALALFFLHKTKKKE
ncbi:putative membrane protein [Beggiatoa alba B18LD]|uniref:Putative membrane protein n=1 Tax=Beggiatoa alba B18LD TaxID=395493 RepID=I3CD40_9GAMM|nr:YqhA family protein [Beggiatoa alba]EIJ41533.1 putative membrane protein [Beggiatoa alba B18LD]